VVVVRFVNIKSKKICVKIVVEVILQVKLRLCTHLHMGQVVQPLVHQ
jgi:hypothetical protein